LKPGRNPVHRRSNLCTSLAVNTPTRRSTSHCADNRFTEPPVRDPQRQDMQTSVRRISNRQPNRPHVPSFRTTMSKSEAMEHRTLVEGCPRPTAVSGSSREAPPRRR